MAGRHDRDTVRKALRVALVAAAAAVVTTPAAHAHVTKDGRFCLSTFDKSIDYFNSPEVLQGYPSGSKASGGEWAKRLAAAISLLPGRSLHPRPVERSREDHATSSSSRTSRIAAAVVATTTWTVRRADGLAHGGKQSRSLPDLLLRPLLSKLSSVRLRSPTPSLSTTRLTSSTSPSSTASRRKASTSRRAQTRPQGPSSSTC